MSEEKNNTELTVSKGEKAAKGFIKFLWAMLILVVVGGCIAIYNPFEGLFNGSSAKVVEKPICRHSGQFSITVDEFNLSYNIGTDYQATGSFDEDSLTGSVDASGMMTATGNVWKAILQHTIEGNRIRIQGSIQMIDPGFFTETFGTTIHHIDVMPQW